MLSRVLLAAIVSCGATANGGTPRVARYPCAPEVRLPANVTFADDKLLSMTSEIARRSSTFRAQLLKVGAAPMLRVRLRLTAPLGGAIRARTVILRTTGGRLTAESEIPVRLIFDRQYVEMIAHEIEHVIEQTEGLDLSALARDRHTGVRRHGWDGISRFETDRAMSMGEAVKHEFHDEARIASCVGRQQSIVSEARR